MHVSVSNVSACVCVHTYVCCMCVSLCKVCMSVCVKCDGVRVSECEGKHACQCFKHECLCVHVCVYIRMCVLCVSLCKWLCACVSVHVVVTVVNCPSSYHTMLCDCLLLELTACCTDHAGPTSHGTLTAVCFTG